MRVCVVGGGPAGLYTADLLLSRGIETTLYEKDAELGGMYRYSLLPMSKMSPFLKLLKDPNLHVHLNTPVDSNRLLEMENDFDAFVIATGSAGPRRLDIPGSGHCIDGLELVRSWFGSKGWKLGKKVLVIGMGNVSMDIAKFLLNWQSPFFRFPVHAVEGASDVTDITICSRSNVDTSAFTKPSLRTVLDIPHMHLDVDGVPSGSMEGKGVGGILGRRLAQALKEGSKRLRLLFNTSVDRIERHRDEYVVDLRIQGKVRQERYDSIISSIGFEMPGVVDLGLKKPVYHVGWARQPKGSIEAAKADADKVVGMICGQQPTLKDLETIDPA